MLSLIIAAGLSTGQVYRMESPYEAPAVHYRMETPPEVRAPGPGPAGGDYEVTIPDGFRWERKPGGESLVDAVRRFDEAAALARDEARKAEDREIMEDVGRRARAKQAERKRKFPIMTEVIAREQERAWGRSVPEPIIGDDTVMPNVYPTAYTPPQPAVIVPQVRWTYPVVQTPYAIAGVVCGPSGCGPAVSYGAAPRRGPIARIFGR
jgi:hypothetical protein